MTRKFGRGIHMRCVDAVDPSRKPRRHVEGIVDKSSELKCGKLLILLLPEYSQTAYFDWCIIMHITAREQY